MQEVSGVMPVQHHTVLLVGSEKTVPAIGGLFGGGFTRAAAYSGAEARRRLLTGEEFDLAVIKSPLSDEFGDDLALTLSERPMEVILLTQAERLEDCAERMSGSGVLVISLPIVRPLFMQTVSNLMETHGRLMALRRENERLRGKLEETRRIGLAKCLLVEHERMSEAEAHRYIEKNAMDLRLSRAEVATMIMARYGDG